MTKEIEIKTYFISSDFETETLHKNVLFSNWDEAEIFLIDRIQLKRELEIFKIEIGSEKFGELNKNNFGSLHRIKEVFLKLMQEDNAERKEQSKRSRIEIRIDQKEKENVLKKCENIGLNISEYTRQLYEYGEVIIVSDQLKKDVRGMAINLNQIAKKLNAGGISKNNVILELETLLNDLNKLYRR